MASFVHLIDQRRLIGPGGSTVAGDIYFYFTGTNVLAPVYNDASLLIPSENPISVGAGEIVPNIFLDDSITYRRVIQYSDGTYDEQDPIGNLFSEGDIGVPVGAVLDFSGATPPEGFLFCFGQELLRGEYSDLFSAIGTTYGSGNGITTFNIPDYRGRVTAGKDNMGGVAAGILTTPYVDGTTLGAKGGTQAVQLTEAQLPSHTHSINDPGHAHNYTGSSGGAGPTGYNPSAIGSPQSTQTHVTGVTLNPTGGNEGHTNVQPTIVTNKIIKVFPVTFLSLLGIQPDFTNKANAVALGVTPTASNMGNYTSPLVPDNQSAKQNIEALAMAVENKLDIVNPVSTGVSRNNLASYPLPQNSYTTTATYNGTTTITVVDGSQINDGDGIYASFVSEPVYVVSGGGTNTIVMSRAATGSGTASVRFGTNRWDLSSTTVGDTAGYRRVYVGSTARGRSTIQPRINGQGLDYPEVSAFTCENENGGVSGWFASTMSKENTGLTSLISLGTYCLIDEDPVNRHSWNAYDQSNLKAGTAPTGTAQFIQRECSLESYWPVVTTDPYNYNPPGSTRIFRLDPGIGTYAERGEPFPNNISHYIDFVDNGAKALKGIIFGFDSLVNGGQAIALTGGAPQHSISWYSGTNAESWKIFSSATTGNAYLWHQNSLVTFGETDIAVTKNSVSAQKVISFRTSNTSRWTVGSTATTEGGSNAGSDLAFARFSDAGTFLSVPFSIRRSSGRISLAGVQAETSYANDAAAAAGGVQVGEIYRNGSVLQIRIS